jgi:hypothetical protein
MSSSSQAHEAEFRFSSPNGVGARGMNGNDLMCVHMSELTTGLSKDQTVRDELCYNNRSSANLVEAPQLAGA